MLHWLGYKQCKTNSHNMTFVDPYIGKTSLV